VRTRGDVDVQTFWCKSIEFFVIYGVSAQTRGRGVESVRTMGEEVNFSLILCGRSLRTARKTQPVKFKLNIIIDGLCCLKHLPKHTCEALIESLYSQGLFIQNVTAAWWRSRRNGLNKTN